MQQTQTTVQVPLIGGESDHPVRDLWTFSLRSFSMTIAAPAHTEHLARQTDKDWVFIGGFLTYLTTALRLLSLASLKMSDLLLPRRPSV
jgi:hypothetical protein